jgi:hypothetical protein
VPICIYRFRPTVTLSGTGNQTLAKNEVPYRSHILSILEHLMERPLHNMKWNLMLVFLAAPAHSGASSKAVSSH